MTNDECRRNGRGWIWRREGSEGVRGGSSRGGEKAHVLDVPEVVTIGDQEYRYVPVLSREEALEQAASQNRRRLANGPAWDGQWSLVVELSTPLPGISTRAEFADSVGIESRTVRSAARLVRPTDAERARFEIWD